MVGVGPVELISPGYLEVWTSRGPVRAVDVVRKGRCGNRMALRSNLIMTEFHINTERGTLCRNDDLKTQRMTA